MPPRMRACGCGYALHQHYWGQGYMPEALQAAFTYAFTVLLTRLIHAECERANTASARVMQKCGMEYAGTMYDDDGLGNWEHRSRYLITAESAKTALICSSSPESLSSTGRCFSSACFPSSRCATRGPGGRQAEYQPGAAR